MTTVKRLALYDDGETPFLARDERNDENASYLGVETAPFLSHTHPAYFSYFSRQSKQSAPTKQSSYYVLVWEELGEVFIYSGVLFFTLPLCVLFYFVSLHFLHALSVVEKIGPVLL